MVDASQLMKSRVRKFPLLQCAPKPKGMLPLHESSATKIPSSAQIVLFLTIFAAIMTCGDSFAGTSGSYSLEIAPEKYGNILLSKKCVSAGQKEVLFTHWTHRMLYSCRVCHLELGFPMGVNETDITMDLNRSGKFCGFCHDGKEAFGTTDKDCQKCHRGNEDFNYGEKVDRLTWLPESRYGNQVDWNAALEDGDIKPIFCLNAETCKSFDFSAPEEIEMAITVENVPPVIFPHAKHTFWLDCLNCHRGNLVNRGGEVKFLEQGQYRREFCEGCHSKIAFPMDNCMRCHPGMDNDW